MVRCFTENHRSRRSRRCPTTPCSASPDAVSRARNRPSWVAWLRRIAASSVAKVQAYRSEPHPNRNGRSGGSTLAGNARRPADSNGSCDSPSTTPRRPTTGTPPPPPRSGRCGTAPAPTGAVHRRRARPAGHHRYVRQDAARCTGTRRLLSLGPVRQPPQRDRPGRRRPASPPPPAAPAGAPAPPPATGPGPPHHPGDGVRICPVQRRQHRQPNSTSVTTHRVDRVVHRRQVGTHQRGRLQPPPRDLIRGVPHPRPETGGTR